MTLPLIRCLLNFNKAFCDWTITLYPTNFDSSMEFCLCDLNGLNIGDAQILYLRFMTEMDVLLVDYLNNFWLICMSKLEFGFDEDVDLHSMVEYSATPKSSKRGLLQKIYIQSLIFDVMKLNCRI